MCVSETEACDENLKFPDVKGYVVVVDHSLTKKKKYVSHSLDQHG